MAAATTAPSISQNGGSVAPKNSITSRFSAMFDKLSPSDSSKSPPQDRHESGQGTPAQAQSQSISKGARQSLPKSQSYNNAKGNQHREPNTEHVGDGKRLDHKDSRVGEAVREALPPRNQIWKSGGDEVIAKRPEEKGIGGRNENLSAEDFEPLRILGTGTFARVWQVKMKDVQKEKDIGFGENKVYALKVLRKDQGLLRSLRSVVEFWERGEANWL